ncbi:hypothetical protein [Leisingera sp. ANG-M1]|uniref:hypothetical protein n=1 Tax=Leisingera sp. ANG-M1 TaxID=1577895 RepID=UPI000AC09C2D|nr:hypothetical protein [Leisingera sp. ANG-M1]
MRFAAVLLPLPLLVLAACETPGPAAEPPQKHAPAETGVSVSGYARVGVSHRF